MTINEWSILISSIHTDSGVLLKGQDLDEWLSYVRTDYDEIDRYFIYQETNGGG